MDPFEFFNVSPTAAAPGAAVKRGLAATLIPRGGGGCCTVLPKNDVDLCQYARRMTACVGSYPPKPTLNPRFFIIVLYLET